MVWLMISDDTMHFHDFNHRLNKLITEVHKMASELDTGLAALTAQVQANTDVVQSAVTLVQGFAAQIEAAVQAALAAGASPEELKAVTDAVAAIKADDDALAAAVAANTQPPPPPPPPPSPPSG